MRPAPTVPVSTAKPWVRARRLLWGSGFRSGARLPRYSRSGPSRHIAAPALSGPVPAEASRPRSVPVRVIHRSWASPGPNEMSSTAKALKETSCSGSFGRTSLLLSPAKLAKRPSILFRSDPSLPPCGLRSEILSRFRGPKPSSRWTAFVESGFGCRLALLPFGLARPLSCAFNSCEFQLLSSGLCL